MRELLARRNWGELREYLSGLPSPDSAAVLMELPKAERVLLFRLLPRSAASEVFSYLEAGHKDSLSKDLTDEEARRLLADLSPDDRTEFLEELPGQAIQRLLNLLSLDDLKEARLLLGYPEESVGRLMTPDYVAVRPEWSIEQSLEHIRSRGKDSETVNVIYVVDAGWKLVDALDLRRFILAPPSERVETLMDFAFVSISPLEDREKAAQLMQHYDLIALPVADSAGILLGIVTVDDVLDVLEEETTEDFQKTAAVNPLKLSYPEVGLWGLYRRRIVWLATLLGLNLFSAGVIAAFEEALASVIALVFFLPLLMGSGGNVGSQSAALIVRAISTGDLKLDRWFSTAFREAAVGILLGGTIGTLIWVLGLFKGGLEIALVASLAMVIVVFVANLLGVFFPFLLARLGADPAMASGPLITSTVDVTVLLIYFSIASRILGLV
jgi:magnesium transporter